MWQLQECDCPEERAWLLWLRAGWCYGRVGSGVQSDGVPDRSPGVPRSAIVDWALIGCLMGACASPHPAPSGAGIAALSRHRPLPAVWPAVWLKHPLANYPLSEKHLALRHLVNSSEQIHSRARISNGIVPSLLFRYQINANVHLDISLTIREFIAMKSGQR